MGNQKGKSHDVIEFKIGATYHIYQGPGKPYKIHICAIVDDEYIVYKWYGRRKQWWHYEVEWNWSLSREIERAKRRRQNHEKGL